MIVGGLKMQQEGSPDQTYFQLSSISYRIFLAIFSCMRGTFELCFDLTELRRMQNIQVAPIVLSNTIVKPLISRPDHPWTM